MAARRHHAPAQKRSDHRNAVGRFTQLVNQCSGEDFFETEDRVAQLARRLPHERGQATHAKPHSEDVDPAARPYDHRTPDFPDQHRLRLNDPLADEAIAEMKDNIEAAVGDDPLRRRG